MQCQQSRLDHCDTTPIAQIDRSWASETHIPRKVFEDVGLERHVDIDGPNDVAQLAVFDLE